MPLPSPAPGRRPPGAAKRIAASLGACAATLLATPAGAEVTLLPETVVTATRIARTADETLAPVTVITREDVERRQARSLPDLLRGLPGVTFANNGGRGQQSALFLRGAESDHVLVLVDGVRVGSAGTGQFGFQHLPIALVERVEVVRGPRASLYGSDAVGGVVQIFTRRGGGEPVSHATLGAGSRGALDASAGLSGGGGRGWFNVTGSFAREQGINVRDPRVAMEPDRDGFGSHGASLRAGYRFGNGVEVEGRMLHDRSRVEYDGSWVNESTARQSLWAGTLGLSPREGWRATVQAARSRDDVDSFRDGGFRSAFVTRRDEVSWQNDVDVGEAHLLSVGFDYREERLSGSTAYTVDERDNKGVFAHFLAAFGDHDLHFAGRHDDNEQFGGAETGSLTWGWQLRDALRFTASYGTAFHAPTFNELYFPSFGDCPFSNPALVPEESKSLDFGLSSSPGPVRWSLNAFRSEVENLIANVGLSTPGCEGLVTASNVERARIRGLEGSLETRLGGFDASASLTLLDPRNHGPRDLRGNQLPRRPRQVLRLDLDRGAGRLAYGATVHAAGSRYDDAENTQSIGGFGTVDLRAAYRVGADWSLEGRVENLLDRSHRTVHAYEQPGRGFFVTFRYRP